MNVDFQIRRISSKQLARAGWHRLESLGIEVWKHREGWQLERQPHPTANFPWLLSDPHGQVILTGAAADPPNPFAGRAWPTLAAAVQYVAQITDARAAAEGASISLDWFRPIEDISGKSGQLERESPLFCGAGENPLLF